jgi:hypothetical protein
MAVIFPDVERVLVQALDAALSDIDSDLTGDVHVSTIKPPADYSPYPAKIITIRGDGGPQLDDVRKLERVGLMLYVHREDASLAYREANALARVVEAVCKTLTVDGIKNVNVVLSPVRMAEASPAEARYMTLEVITKGSTL